MDHIKSYNKMVQLFWQSRIINYFEAIKENTKKEIENIPKEDILGSDEEEQIEYLFEKFKLSPVVIDEKGISRSDSMEVKVDITKDYQRDVFNRSRRTFIQGTSLKIYIPFSGNCEFLKYQPTTYQRWNIDAEISKENNEIILHYIRPTDTLDLNELEKTMEREINLIKEMVKHQVSDVNNFNENELKVLIRTLFTQRKTFLKKGQKVISNLSIPLKRKPPEKLKFQPPRKKRPLKPSTTNPQVAEPVLDFKEYRYIIDVINSMGLSLEQCSETVRGLNEEDLRLLFLIILNSHYDNQASGETFNKSGKTDIIIKNRGRNIFIAECKIWNGDKTFNEGVEQLLKYLTWRDTKCSYIIFCRRKDFTKIIQKAFNLISGHDNFIQEIEKINETCIIYKFKSKSDEKRELFLTLHLFNTVIDKND